MNKSKPRLLVTTSTLPRHEHDPEPRFVLDLARALSDRFDITVLAPSFPGAKPQATLFGVEIAYYRYAPFRSWERLAYPGGIMPRLKASPMNWLLVPGLVLGQAIALRRLLKRNRFNLVHAHWTLPQGLVAAALPGTMRPPLVVTSHGGDVFTLGSGPFRGLVRYVLRRACATTVVSAELLAECRAILATADDSGNTDSRFHHIPMGVDCAHFANAASKASRPADMPPQGPVILFVGRLAPKKGVNILLDALAEPLAGLSGAQLVIIGDGPARDEWLAQAKRLDLANRVHFLGSRDHRSLPAYFAAADIIALPSVHSRDGDKDGLPVTLLEAAACSLPAIASRLAGIPEFIEEGYNGMLVPPGDSHALALALAELLSNSDRRRSYSRAALAKAGEFDWSVIADRHASVFLSVLSADVAATSTERR